MSKGGTQHEEIRQAGYVVITTFDYPMEVLGVLEKRSGERGEERGGVEGGWNEEVCLRKLCGSNFAVLWVRFLLQ